MTFRIIKQEFDRYGRAVCLFWLQGGNNKKTPTDKNSSAQVQARPPGHPFFKETEREGL